MTAPFFTSEELEPFAAMVVGRFFARCEWEKEHGDKFSLEDACDNFQHAANALSSLSIATNMGAWDDPNRAVHFSIASMNEVQRVSRYIEELNN